MRGRTALVISHRPFSALQGDRIAFIEQGLQRNGERTHSWRRWLVCARD